jgi:hypothetical protein
VKKNILVSRKRRILFLVNLLKRNDFMVAIPYRFYYFVANSKKKIYMKPIAGKARIIVTGAARGIGLARRHCNFRNLQKRAQLW